LLVAHRVENITYRHERRQVPLYTSRPVDRLGANARRDRPVPPINYLISLYNEAHVFEITVITPLVMVPSIHSGTARIIARAYIIEDLYRVTAIRRFSYSDSRYVDLHKFDTLLFHI